MAKNGRGSKSSTKPDNTASNNSGTSAMEEEYTGLDPQIVEGVLFGFPRSQLMASEVFRDMLTDEHLGSPKEGTEENPIRIDKISQVSLSQVKAFYKVLNCRRFDAEPALTIVQWCEALQLATTWGFQTLRQFIIAHLDSLLDEPLSRIAIADVCGVKDWLHPAYAKLCAQETPLTVKEGRVLGLGRFAALCRIREQGMKIGGYGSGMQPPNPYGYGSSSQAYVNLAQLYGFRPPGTPRNAYNASSFGQGVSNCQRKCCKPPFELNSREQGFLSTIAGAEDL
ncbi:hypothetical protein FS837_004182 [Tulasnella sp. UAMH 9824]|nr:hypothetical protein FS837_004182 [Tulasnella sp. UAMH 9824]